MSILKKKRVISFICYSVIFIGILLPMQIFDHRKYSFLSLSIRAVRYTKEFEGAIILQASVLIVYLIFALLYLLSCSKGRGIRINLLNVFSCIIFAGLHFSEPSMLAYFENQNLGKIVVYLILIITIIEFVVRIFPEKRDIRNKAVEIQEKTVINQNQLFYRIIWKNFKKNWKDYLLIVVCSIILFTVAIVTFSMKELLEGNYGTKKIQIFNGLTEILLNAMIPMAILAVFLIVIIVFYYLKTRARNYGIFLTLGMHRKVLYFITALEFLFVLILSIGIGGVIGQLFVKVIIQGLQKRFEFTTAVQAVGTRPFFYSLATILGILIISFMAARDIFYDFNVGKSEDMRGIAEKIPGKERFPLFIAGIVLCLYSVLQYRKLTNFENEYLLLVYFIGMYFLIRNGIAIYLIRERRNKTYLNKLLLHNQLFHKSKTNTGFITVLSIIKFCILFFFSFQLFATMKAEDIGTMFPFDFVCFADESDDAILKEIEEKYDIKMYEFPMVRVTAYDSTEKMENEFKASQKPIQGQHIGIAESTYHKLKGLVDSTYEKKDLALLDKTKAIYVVYQQDRAVKAQPTAFYIPRKTPLLHIGRPCRSVNPFQMSERYDNGYYYYNIVGEEITSLTGIFHQGLRENIIVFSDEYFRKAQNMWKTMNIYTGEQIEEEDMRIPGFTITQGVTKLVLINVNQKEKNKVEKALEGINQKHLDEENEIYKMLTPYGNYASGIYDSSVSYLYKKEEAIISIQTERIMKEMMCIAAIIIFGLLNLLIIIVKLLSELQMDKKRIGFLNCMGMPKQERLKLLRHEIIYYYCILPMILAIISSAIFTSQVFHARMYTFSDITNHLGVYCIFSSIYTIFYIFIMIIISRIYSRKVEKEAVL